MNELQNAATGGKNQDRTRNSVLRQMALLQSMSLEQLREKWLDLYGEEPPQYKKQFLIKRLAYRIQELFYGGLSEQAKVHLQQPRGRPICWGKFSAQPMMRGLLHTGRRMAWAL